MTVCVREREHIKLCERSHLKARLMESQTTPPVRLVSSCVFMKIHQLRVNYFYTTKY